MRSRRGIPAVRLEDIDNRRLLVSNRRVLDASAGTRKVPFSKVLYIEQDDFREDPPKQYFRLSPGREVRLRYAYLVTCTSVVKNGNGEVFFRNS